ncbi:MAG: DUF2800 domain-containing protein [Lachnospiraceae bacterium]|nr:DUF2800 domain-containing protein [Lachnospiraceae bacterium]
MNFNRHSEIRGTHACFGASDSAWLRYDEEKALMKLKKRYITALGTEAHEFAESQIRLCNKITSNKDLSHGFRTYIYRKYLDGYGDLLPYGSTLLEHIQYMPKTSFETMKTYINDGIGFRMETEQPLKYSDYFYGTADSISFRDNFLRIHDLKTGITPVHMEQLEIYAALFCLEYKVKPGEIEMELRIYQNNEVLYLNPTAEEILPIMDRIVSLNKTIIRSMDKEG